MKLTEANLIQDEALSNHAVVAIRCTACPLSEPRMCFGIATGFGGGIIGKCEFCSPTDGGSEALCTHQNAKEE